MKKKCSLVAVLMLCAVVSQAQTFEEWFRQRKTQLKYLVEQIAAFKVYADYLQKGYTIAKEGLHTINDIKNGDFFLHQGHFDSLLVVNPAISESFYVVDAILLAEKISVAATGSLQQAEQDVQFTEAEQGYLQKVYSNIMDETAADVDQLTRLVTDGALQMKDDERLQNIETIYRSVQDKYAFVKNFSRQQQMLAVRRIKRQSETDMIKKLYNLK